MNTLQRGILDLVKACLTEQPARLPEDFDWTGACHLGNRHSILPMLYYGAVISGADMPADAYGRLRSATLKSAYIDQNQLRELETLQARFQAEGIAFLPLKGTVLKHLYPHTEVRMMADADILIRVEQYGAIRPILEELGYKELVESDHELIWDKKGALHLELHKRLIPSYNKDYYSYFGDGWKLARPAEGTRYQLREEDAFVYNFTHYAKHYRDGGIGIRHLTDLHMSLQAAPHMDLAYVERELETLGLLTFYRNSVQTLRVWFQGAEDTAMSDFLTDRIFHSGSYGTARNHTLSVGAKAATSVKTEKVRGKKLRQLLFPPARALEQNYPVVKRWRILLPFVWCCRGVKVLLFKRDALKSNKQSIDLLTAANISDYQQQLQYVGLSFNFEE